MIKTTHWTKEHNLGGTTSYLKSCCGSPRPETLGKGHLGSWLRVRKHARMLDMILPCISTSIVSRFSTFGFILEWLCQTAMTRQVSTSCTHPALCQQVITNGCQSSLTIKNSNPHVSVLELTTHFLLTVAYVTILVGYFAVFALVCFILSNMLPLYPSGWAHGRCCQYEGIRLARTWCISQNIPVLHGGGS